MGANQSEKPDHTAQPSMSKPMAPFQITATRTMVRADSVSSAGTWPAMSAMGTNTA